MRRMALHDYSYLLFLGITWTTRCYWPFPLLVIWGHRFLAWTVMTDTRIAYRKAVACDIAGVRMEGPQVPRQGATRIPCRRCAVVCKWRRCMARSDGVDQSLAREGCTPGENELTNRN